MLTVNWFVVDGNSRSTQNLFLVMSGLKGILPYLSAIANFDCQANQLLSKYV